ncbi:Na+/H+ antiporter subunit A [Georgenia muralis]|uniref:Multisubunit sodium/proton antiporter MrpA subunit /multisubunit sodium/proton antiporter MrpB subunit n=1 Tax=Georgenia muralis TaxID=154117 RepID=A0A3N5A435_9MICO|nr:Na+/H+ antiporter subunit A [Georgenia muralis]RPF26551.1 multisubunit sodium/proton antiporter MrpA subunit /multisubunit sodium/proton antiporter MrpB subunit [Georgenia muralis]
MLQLLAIHLVAALLAPPLVAWLGRRAFLVLAAAPASAAVWAAAVSGRVLAGDHPEQVVAWVPSLQLELAFRLDTLSWLMTLVVGGVGALVLVYSAAYFSRSAHALGRFAGVFVAFAGSMLGLVTTDDTLMLYVFWELTTVTSFLLIGHYHDRQSSRRAALQAIMVTTFGGLAMLAGLIILGESRGGSYRLGELVATAAAGELGVGAHPALVPTAVALVLLGAVTKSALVPFHFWLPAAMAAPTPVSAYLHAAAMVKAGIYLVARLAPGLSELPVWRWTVVGVGLTTLVIGGYRALRQYDLKLVLAFGTVSQLGLVMMLVGYGDAAVALAGLAMLLAHALFKSALFLVVGVVDWALGTRDLRKISGLWRRTPVLAAAGALAAASMAGLPPTAGYVAKEAALEGLVHRGAPIDWVVLVGIAAGSALTVAYSLRLWWGAFADKPGVEAAEPQKTSRLIMAAPVLLAVAGVVVGLVPGLVERHLAPHAGTYPGEEGHLTLWGGVGVPLLTTAAILATGLALFLARGPVERLQRSFRDLEGAEGAYRRLLRALDNVAADVTAWTQRGSLPAYLSIILLTTITLAGGAALLGGDTWPEGLRPWDNPLQAVVAVVVAVASVLAARARRRLKAVVLLGVAGYGVALLFELHGAPDLALTQVLVETVTLVVFVLVLRRLPAYFSNRPLVASRWWRAGVAVLAGVTVAGLGVLAAGARIHEPVSVDFPAEAFEFGYGKNIVNVTLVDIRAWDTMGEISVVVVAATGVASLIFLRARSGRIDRPRNLRSEGRAPGAPAVWGGGRPDPAAELRRPGAGAAQVRAPGRGRTWLAGDATLAPQRRSVIFEVGTRLVFHTLIVFSLFLLFSGHNAPGGGFAGGLVAGTALIVRYLAGGRYELGEAAPVHPGLLLGGGLFLSAGAGAVPLLLGGTVLETTIVDVVLPVFGPVKLATALFFDMGVYLVVIGLVLDILRSLGAEVDRQGEIEGNQAPDVAYDDPSQLADDALPARDDRAEVPDALPRGQR